MKRFTALVALLFLLAAASPPLTARADSYPRYARAIVKSAYFFTEANPATAIFCVPYTYCIEVLGEEGEWYRARYAADAGVYRERTGYCRRADFKPVNGVPAVTYLYKTVTVRYAVSTTPTTLPVLSEIAIEAAYYGTYDSGAAAYSYVYCQGSFGYIEGTYDDYPLNEIESETPPPSEEREEQTGGVSAGLISVLVILALFSAVILTLHFATARAAKREG